MSRKPRIAGCSSPCPSSPTPALCGWMYARQRELMYSRNSPGPTRADRLRHRAQRRDAQRLAGQHRAAAARCIYFGGNAERIEDRRDEFARWFPDSSTYLVPYRGYGASEGTPTEADICSPMRWRCSTRCRRASPGRASS